MKPRMKVPTKPAPSRRVTRTHLTITAASSTERPSAWIEQLKDGSYSWGVRVPAGSSKLAVSRVMEQAEILRAKVKTWEDERASAMWQATETRRLKVVAQKEADSGQ
jgi:hypothetical protein